MEEIKGDIRVKEEALMGWAQIKGLNQQGLAKVLGCDDSEVSAWFSKKNPRVPSRQMQRKICFLTGFDIGDFLTFDRSIEQAEKQK